MSTPTWGPLPGTPTETSTQVTFTVTSGYGTHEVRRKGTVSLLASTAVSAATTAPVVTPPPVVTTPTGTTPNVTTLGPEQTGVIPIANALSWYLLNGDGNSKAPGEGIGELTNGNAAKKGFVGWGLVRPLPVSAYGRSNTIANVKAKSIKVTGRSDTPVKIYTRATPSSPEVLLLDYKCTTDDTQVQTLTFSTPVPVYWLRAEIGNNYIPCEIELTGTWQPVLSRTLLPKTHSAFKRKLGINSFPWDHVGSDSLHEDAFKADQLSSFGAERQYLDMYRVFLDANNISFDVTDGTWNADRQLAAAKTAKRIMWQCSQKVPNWLQDLNSRPGDQRDEECVPAAYGLDWTLPGSYKEKAELAFYYSARYGRNTSLDKARLPKTKTGYLYSDWTTPDAPFRQNLVGLDLCDYYEAENERDKNWKGPKAYQNGREAAAMHSACYDGHLGTMGPNYGVKQADPTMQLVWSGNATSDTQYVQGAIDWCEELRGYRPDGTINLCWDVMNYHCYPFSGGIQYASTGNNGAAPELCDQRLYAQAQVALGRQYGYVVWLTETGYDSNPSSPLMPAAIGALDVEHVRGAFALRSAHLHDEEGIDVVCHYQTKDGNFGGQFGTSGFLTDSGWNVQGYYFYQVIRLLGDYVYQETVSVNPTVMRYTNGSSTIYVGYCPTANGSTASYTFPGSSATVYRPDGSSKNMGSTSLSGVLSVTLTETPTYLKVS